MPKALLLLEDRIDTPIGEMIILADEDGNLRTVDWTNHEERMARALRRQYGSDGYTFRRTPNPNGLSDTIRRYFAGELSVIDQLPVATMGTPFQREVWQALRDIPAGTTTTYSALSEKIGRPKAVRAVGMANGANPVGVIVPCHRVIGVDGSLTGYGGGLERKLWLLKHEGVSVQATQMPGLFDSL